MRHKIISAVGLSSAAAKNFLLCLYHAQFISFCNKANEFYESWVYDLEDTIFR